MEVGGGLFSLFFIYSLCSVKLLSQCQIHCPLSPFCCSITVPFSPHTHTVCLLSQRGTYILYTYMYAYIHTTISRPGKVMKLSKQAGILWNRILLSVMKLIGLCYCKLPLQCSTLCFNVSLNFCSCCRNRTCIGV